MLAEALPEVAVSQASPAAQEIAVSGETVTSVEASLTGNLGPDSTSMNF